MEQEILNLFLFNEKLKFSQISKKLVIRTNKLSYHIKNLIEKNILTKSGDYYFLSETAEHLIPYISDKKAILPVILIGIGNKNKCLLDKRKKKPFMGKYGLPAGRIMLGESIEDATKRIMKNKYQIEASFEKINSINIEHAYKNNKPIHSFLLIFVSATTKDKIELTHILKNKTKTIQSDYQLIRNDFDKAVKIGNFKTKL